MQTRNGLKLVGFWNDGPFCPFPHLRSAPYWPTSCAETNRPRSRCRKMWLRSLGWATCRIPGCGANLGSREFSDGTWLWPEGLPHYIAEHQVKPCDEFVQHVLSGGSSSRPPTTGDEPDLTRWIEAGKRHIPAVVDFLAGKARLDSAKKSLAERLCDKFQANPDELTTIVDQAVDFAKRWKASRS